MIALPTLLACAFTSPSSLLARGRALHVAMAALPADVEEAISWDKGTYKDSDVEENFEALVEVYGSEALAGAATKQVRGTVICPIYASPELIRESKSALVEVLGEEEAAVIMRKNPAVLTCGDGLLKADPDEIKRLANAREVLDQIPPQALLAVSVGIPAIIFARIALIKIGAVPPVGAGEISPF